MGGAGGRGPDHAESVQQPFAPADRSAARAAGAAGVRVPAAAAPATHGWLCPPWGSAAYAGRISAALPAGAARPATPATRGTL